MRGLAHELPEPALRWDAGRIHDHVYREYLLAADAKLAAWMGNRMADAIRRMRGREYKVKQAVGLYPTAGASDDYAYSRHLVDPRTIEWGRSHASTPFHPPYDEMWKVMREVTAGLLELDMSARRHKTYIDCAQAAPKKLRPTLLVRGRDGGIYRLKLCCHKTVCSPAISHEDSLPSLEFGEAPAAKRLHVHEYVWRFRTAREKAKPA